MHWSRFVDLPSRRSSRSFACSCRRAWRRHDGTLRLPYRSRCRSLLHRACDAAAGWRTRHVWRHSVHGPPSSFQVHRFEPGGIDHHNVQMALIAIVAARSSIRCTGPQAMRSLLSLQRLHWRWARKRHHFSVSPPSSWPCAGPFSARPTGLLPAVSACFSRC